MHITTLVDRTHRDRRLRLRAAAGHRCPLEDRLDALGAKETDTEITIRMAGSVLFDFDSEAIRPDAQRSLAEILEVVTGVLETDRCGSRATPTPIASESYNQQALRAARAVGGRLAGGPRYRREPPEGRRLGRKQADRGQ